MVRACLFIFVVLISIVIVFSNIDYTEAEKETAVSTASNTDIGNYAPLKPDVVDQPDSDPDIVPSACIFLGNQSVIVKVDSKVSADEYFPISGEVVCRSEINYIKIQIFMPGGEKLIEERLVLLDSDGKFSAQFLAASSNYEGYPGRFYVVATYNGLEDTDKFEYSKSSLDDEIATYLPLFIIIPGIIVSIVIILIYRQKKRRKIVSSIRKSRLK